jgi:hypothetical protein
MNKQGKKNLLTKLEDTITMLQKQQSDAKAVFEKCQGAIEVLQQIVSEEKDEQKS